MNRPLRILSFLLQFATVGLALAFVVTQFFPSLGERVRESAGVAAPQITETVAVPTTQTTNSGPVSYSDAVMRAAPAVVNIYANRIVTERTYQVVPDPLLRRFFGSVTLGPPRQRLQQSLGSGVILSPDGYVLTNHHVIRGADGIQALLRDGRVTEARVVGTDPDTDLAVLKIEGSNLPSATIAADTALNIGDVVLAIGNPFGMGQTVTHGIVSATGRSQLHLSTYEDFIQTDAAINSGNSGGALVNARGELVGINTAVFGRGEGISFAIPVSTAKQVMDQIVATGQVVRGWLGAEYGEVALGPLGPATDSTRGVMVAAVYPNGPAALAGLQPGDILLKLDGEDILDTSDIKNREAALAPGAVAQVSGTRAGVPFETRATLMQRPQISEQG